MLSRLTLFAAATLASAFISSFATARDGEANRFSKEDGRATETEAAITERMNANTVSVITGTPGGTYFRIGADLAFVLDDGDRLRVLPILGKGAGENAYDIRFLKGVDLGFVRTDTVEQLRQDKRLRNVEQHIHYVAKLFNDELHVIAPREVEDVRQLAGKKVTFDVKGSGTDFTGRAMFKGLGIEVEAVNVDQPTALDLLRKGEVSAVASVAAKPVSVLSNFDPSDRFRFLAIPYPDTIGEAYVPATLSSADYPRMVKPGETVETLAVGTILGVYNSPQGSPRYKKVARFVEAFFGNFDKFLSPQRHPKWREVNLAASVNGWTRFRPAQEWLDSHGEQEVASSAEFERFLADKTPDSNSDKEGLYRAYLKWRRTRGEASGSGAMAADASQPTASAALLGLTPAPRGPMRNDAADYCRQRFRSYDPANGTYLGNDGRRHPCR
jgi:TRAP transporter TAXI family solute receptor